MGCCNSKEKTKKPLAAPSGSNAGAGGPAASSQAQSGVASGDTQRSLPAASVSPPRATEPPRASDVDRSANNASEYEAERQGRLAKEQAEQITAQQQLAEMESVPRCSIVAEEAQNRESWAMLHSARMALLRIEREAEEQRQNESMALRSSERRRELQRETMEEHEADARGLIVTREHQAQGKLEDHIQEVLTVQELREKHEREKKDPSKQTAPIRSRRKRPNRLNASLLDRLLVPLQGKNMQPRDMPEIVETLGKLSVHARVQEELRLAHALAAGYRGSAAFLSSARRDPFKVAASTDTSMEVGGDHFQQLHGRSARLGTDESPYDAASRPTRSTSVCSRCSHASAAFVRSHSVNSAWARDTSDRWNYSDYNMAGVPRYSPRRVKPKRARTASCMGRLYEERTPGPGSHTGIVLTHY